MKKQIFILSILVCLFGLSLDASARYRGDLNGDDRVDLADMVYLAKAIKSGSTDKSLDVNASGKVDDNDLHKLADIIINGTLSEESGMNVGIGGWEDAGEDFGGTVKAPAFTTRSAGDIRFYMSHPKSEGNDLYSMEFGISEGNEMPGAIFFNIRLPREMQFDQSKMVELENSISSTHKLYGTPKFKKEDENDEWSPTSLRFIVMSPDLTALPTETRNLGKVYYSRGEYWGNPVFANCQTASPDSDECSYIDEHSADYNGNFLPIEVSSVWFNESEMTLTEGDEGWLYANIDPWDATDQNLIWNSSNENVATIYTEDGRNATIKALRSGETSITATSSNGISATCIVKVEKRIVEVSGIYLNEGNVNMTEGDAMTLTATIDPEDATDKTINWSSSDEGIASVNANGAEAVVTAMAPGYVEIYASASNGMTATCYINVEARVIDVAEVTLDHTELNMTEGDTAWLTASINPEDATDKSLTWTSSDESVASVSDNGEVTAVNAGTATIIVSSANGKTATCTVTVAAKVIEVESVELDNTELNLTEGDIANLTATVNPYDATDKSLTWTSSDEAVATVSANGEVAAVKAGTATITVSAANDKSASCTVNVKQRIVEVTGIILGTKEMKLTEGETATLIATIQPADATDQTLTWASSDENVATVSSTGEVTAIKAGTATITVSTNNGVSATCAVSVESGIISVASVTLDKNELSLTEGDTATLTATVNPTDATDKTLSWTSSDESVATVSDNGEVNAIKAGTATIIVSSANGKTATCSVTVEAKVIEVESVVLDNAEISMTEGDSTTLTATVNPSDATDKSLTWTSSDESVATVSANGEVTAVKAGTTTITVSSANGKSASCTVNVKQRIVEVTGIILSTKEMKLTEGETTSLIATIQPADATDKTLTWTSSDENVATVSSTGEVTAIKAGTATIMVSAANGVSATCTVTVESGIIGVASVTLDKNELSLTEGDAATLTATVNPSDATDKTLSWTSSDESVAIVSDNGEVKAIKAGTATIIVSSSNGKTATCSVTVEAKVIEVESVVLDKSELSMTEGDSATLTATVNPSDATDKSLTWTSSDESVATVSANGEVTAVKAGTATITVSSANGKSANCTVNVEQRIVEVTGIILSTKEMKLTEGETATLIATIQPADATDKTLTWTSSDENVATVSSTGEVTAIKAGTATIMVSAANGVSSTCIVTVESGIIGVASVTLDKNELSLTEGDAATLTATVNPSDATDKTLSWTSSDESVATVSDNGEVTAIKAGIATIIVSSANGKTATCTVTVIAKVIEVESVVLDKTELRMTEGDSATLTATVNPSDATDKSLTWTSSDESVATVSANGEVKAVKAGTATITVSAANGKSANCTVNVEQRIVEVTGIILSNKEMKLTEGETATLIATIQPADATDKTLTWTSSDENVAIVSANGEVTAIKSGTATITVSTNNGVSATCAVSVESGIIGVASVTLDKSELSLTEGESAKLTATVNPADATDKTLSWTSSDEAIVTVSDNGEVNAIKAGTATIIVSSANGKTATCTVTVVAKVIEVESVVLDKTELNMTEGDVANINANVNPSDATDKSLTWTSSDESVATVSANGEVKAVKAGTATITVSSANGKSASCTITVKQRIVEVTGIILSTKEMKLTEGETATLIATIQPADATDKTLAWTSSDESVATVSASGEIKAIKAGSATITVSAVNGISATCTVSVESGLIGVASITLDKNELSLTEGDAATLTATVNPSDATDKTLSWTSSDESVATVSANGEVTAIKAGNATIIVSSANGKTATCTVTVVAKVIDVESVVLDKTELNMTEGDVANINATVNPSDATDKSLTWTSSDESVATVSANGEVKALKAGTATINVSSVNGKSASCTVNVKQRIVEVTGIILSTKEMKLTEGEKATLIATIQPADATDKTLTWTSSDENVATVSSTGEVTAIKSGTATITVSTNNGVSATCAVSVESGIIGVASVTLDKNELSLTEGDAATLTATVNPSDATDKTLSWTSSDESVATVSDNGEVKAIKAGNATIIVSSANGKTATCTVTVVAKVIDVESVVLDKTELNMTEGDVANINATVNPSDATDKSLTWTSSDESVATVSANGEVKALKAGTATITVSSANGKSASCTVNVKQRIVEVTGIVLSTKGMKLTEGETATLIATIQPADATDKTLTWTSSDENVATVSSTGEVTAIKAGTATIMVSAANGVSATCTVTVESGIIGVASITLDKNELSLTEGDAATLTATVNPSDATDKTLSWTSSYESVATVSDNGEVTAIKAGTATIIVSSANGKTATCTVTVIAKVIEVESVVLDKSELSMTEGDNITLTATVNPSDATDKSLTWTSSDESVATVSANGEVKAVKAGTATITVSSANGMSASCTVYVEQRIVEVTGIVLSTKEMKLTEGETATLIATIQPADATDKTLTWTSSDENVATVSSTGEVTALKSGTATITVSTNNGVSATCAVSVESGIIGVASVTLDKNELSLTEGDAATLTATVNPSDATDKTLSWTSSDESVATVSDNGDVRAVKAGTATIIVSSSNGKTATCTVTVVAKVIEVESVVLDKTELNMTEGDNITLTATVNPSDATDKSLTWTSSDESVATVSANGEVKAVKAGTATITVSSANGMSASCTVYVEQRIVEVTGIILSTKEMKLTEGENATLIATIQPADATDKTLTWTSSDENVATVSSTGEVTAIKAGTATITVRATNGISATCKVTVESGIIGVASVTLDKNELSLTEGESAKLTATVNPANATDKTLSWTSSDKSVATVSDDGEVTAITAGTATIIVSSSNGKTATCIVTVEAKVIEIEDIILSDEELALEVGETYRLTVQIVPADATFQDLEWWIEDETIANITNDGLLTVTGEGTTTIHVRSVYNNEIEATCKLNATTDVANIIQDDANCDVYDLNGKLLKKAIHPNDLRDLDKGLYIVIQGNRRSKIMI